MSRKPHVVFDWNVRQAYLEELARTGRKKHSATVAGATLGTVRRHRKQDDDFAADEEEAMEVYRDQLRKEIFRRGVEGVEEPVYYQGEVVGSVVRYSDRMLELESKRHMPEYRDRQQVDHTVNGGVLVVSKEKEDVDQWARRSNGVNEN